MINFRFHLVSLVAVFLALALGIVVGSTLIDRAIVDALRNRIDTVEANLDDADQANDELRADRDELEEYVAESAPWTVEGRLPGTPVLVLAPRGLERDVLGDTVARLREAGAGVEGVVWFEEAWRLEDDDDVESLADASGLAVGPPAELRDQALAALVAEISGDDSARPHLSELIEQDFVAVESFTDDEVAIERLGSVTSHAVVAVGNEAALAEEGVAERLTRELVGRGVLVTVAEVYEDGDDAPARGDALAFVRDEGELAAQVSTVDDLEVLPGRVATVLALAELGQGRVGQYGVGSDAQAPLPAPQPADAAE